MNRKIVPTLIFLAFIFATQLEAKELIFGVYASDKATKEFAEYRPILDCLEKKLSDKEIKFKIKIVKTYQEGLDNIVNGKFDMTRFGPASYVLARNKSSKIKLLVQDNKKGKLFKGHFITSEKTGINNLKDLKNHKRGKLSFAFGDKNSTIGRFGGQAKFVELGISKGDFKNTQYLGRHDKVASAVLAGQFDAGIVKSSAYKKYKDKGLRSFATINIQTKPWLMSSKVSKELFNDIQSAMLSFKKGDNCLKVLRVDGFYKSKDENYNDIRKMMKLAESF